MLLDRYLFVPLAVETRYWSGDAKEFVPEIRYIRCACEQNKLFWPANYEFLQSNAWSQSIKLES